MTTVMMLGDDHDDQDHDDQENVDYEVVSFTNPLASGSGLVERTPKKVII